MKELLPFAILYEEDFLGPISHLAFSPNGLLAIASQGAEVWDLSERNVPDEPLAFFPGAFMPPIAWSPDGSRLAVGQEKRVAIYSIDTQKEVSSHVHDGAAKIIAWSPDGTSLISCSEYQQCHVWQHKTGMIVKEHTFTLTPFFLLWFPDQRIATNPFQYTEKSAFTSSKWQVQLWKDEQGSIAYLLDDKERRCDEYTCASFALSSASLALGTMKGYVQIWRIPRGETPVRALVFPFHVNRITGLAWSPDEKLLASGSTDGHVVVWNEQGDILYHTGYRPSGEMGVRAVAWWRNLLAVAYDDGQIGLYRVPETSGSYEEKTDLPVVLNKEKEGMSEEEAMQAVIQPVEAETFLTVRWVCPVCGRKCFRRIRWMNGKVEVYLVGMPHKRPGSQEMCPENVDIIIRIEDFRVEVFNVLRGGYLPGRDDEKRSMNQ